MSCFHWRRRCSSACLRTSNSHVTHYNRVPGAPPFYFIKTIQLACHDARRKPRFPSNSNGEYSSGFLSNGLVERRTHFVAILLKSTPKTESLPCHKNGGPLLTYDRQWRAAKAYIRRHALNNAAATKDYRGRNYVRPLFRY